MDAGERHATRARDCNAAMDASRTQRDELIRLAHDNGASVRRIAVIVGISYGRVAQIIRGE